MPLAQPAPQISSVEIVAAQPSELDRAEFSRLSAAAARRSNEGVSYVVKVKMKTKPPATSMAWRLYAGDELIPKYWEYSGGIYFTLMDPQFFTSHKGKTFRFSIDGVEFFDTGVKITEPARVAAAKPAAKSARAVAKSSSTLPTQAEVVR